MFVVFNYVLRLWGWFGMIWVGFNLMDGVECDGGCFCVVCVCCLFCVRRWFFRRRVRFRFFGVCDWMCVWVCCCLNCWRVCLIYCVICMLGCILVFGNCWWDGLVCFRIFIRRAFCDGRYRRWRCYWNWCVCSMMVWICWWWCVIL